MGRLQSVKRLRKRKRAIIPDRAGNRQMIDKRLRQRYLALQGASSIGPGRAASGETGPTGGRPSVRRHMI
jgi:hypothetical protein